MEEHIACGTQIFFSSLSFFTCELSVLFLFFLFTNGSSNDSSDDQSNFCAFPSSFSFAGFMLFLWKIAIFFLNPFRLFHLCLSNINNVKISILIFHVEGKYHFLKKQVRRSHENYCGVVWREGSPFDWRGGSATAVIGESELSGVSSSCKTHFSYLLPI